MAVVLCAFLLVPVSWAQAHRASSKSPHAKPAVHKKAASHNKTAVHRTKYASKGSRYSRSRRSRGQQAITSDRTREIQEALIREHYMEGSVSGSWDSRTQAALVKYQHDNGWQTKVVPDSRALIKLGLGPSREGLLNPETAAIGRPQEIGMPKAIETQADAHK